MKPKIYLLTILTAALVTSVQAQITVVSDSFTRADASGLGTAYVGGAWTSTATDMAISSNQAVYNGGNAGGIYTSSLDYTSRAFDQNSTWGLNMRYGRGGFIPLDWNEHGGTRGGMGFILAANNTDLTTANGYAVVTRDADDTGNTLELISFSGGFTDTSNWTTLINQSSFLAGTNSDNYATVKVEYTAATDTFELFASENATAFSDPLLETNSLGTIANSTFTGSNVVSTGLAFYTSGSALNTYEFDNISYSAIPEPSTLLLMSVALGGLALTRFRSRR